MSDILTELRELEKEATPGPWPAGESWLGYGDKFGDDIALMRAMRNALPKLLDVAAAAREWDAAERQNVCSLEAYRRAVNAELRLHNVVRLLGDESKGGGE